MNILIFNAGSSSLKFSLLEADHERTLTEGGVDWSDVAAQDSLLVRTHADAVAHILSQIGSSRPLHAVGHRVVHGGDLHRTTVRVTDQVKRDIDALAELAPLHNKVSLEVIEATQTAMAHVPQFAAFDTAFHATLPPAAHTYAVPHAWTTDWHLRRYGFHGLSHSYCATRASEMMARQNLRLIILHLGNGASASAVRDGICVDTSMGFTPLDGLVMGTRSGAVDPGMVIYLLRHKGLDADRIDHALNYESGLMGMSGVGSDMRAVLASAAADNPRARIAIDVYVHRLRQTIGAMAATLGGVDALVFTAGVGEHSHEIRQLVCCGLDFLGLQLDQTANVKCIPDADIASPTSRARILVIRTREDLTMLREIKRLMLSQGAEGELQ